MEKIEKPDEYTVVEASEASWTGLREGGGGYGED